MITCSNHSINVVHYKKILKVTMTEIHIEMKEINILISGEDLMIYFLNKDEIILKGNIQKVDFIHERI